MNTFQQSSSEHYSEIKEASLLTTDPSSLMIGFICSSFETSSGFVTATSLVLTGINLPSRKDSREHFIASAIFRSSCQFGVVFPVAYLLIDCLCIPVIAESSSLEIHPCMAALVIFVFLLRVK